MDDAATTEAIDLLDNALRVIVRENGGHYVEYFTFDGLALERQRLVRSRYE